MFTCRTCKLLKHSQAKRDLHINEDGCEVLNNIEKIAESRYE